MYAPCNRKNSTTLFCMPRVAPLLGLPHISRKGFDNVIVFKGDFDKTSKESEAKTRSRLEQSMSAPRTHSRAMKLEREDGKDSTYLVPPRLCCTVSIILTCLARHSLAEPHV
jgi:hypothetical protein